MSHRQVEYVLGIDAGATKTVGLLVGDEGEVIARAETGSASHVNIGIEATQRAIEEIVSGVMGFEPRHIAAACLAMAGVDTPANEEMIRRAVCNIVRADHLVVCNDSVAALKAGTDDSFGVVVNAGTGSIAFGINPEGREMRAGGWSFYLSDEGSGYYLGREALKAMFRTADGRANAYLLSQYVLSYLDLRSLDGLYEYIHDGGLKDDIPGIAALAPEVEHAADDGDPEAQKILRLAGRELAGLAIAVIRGLQMQEEVFDLVLAGGIFRVRYGLRAEFRRKVKKVAPHARITLLRQEPVWGAVRRARELLLAPARSCEHARESSQSSLAEICASMVVVEARANEVEE